MYFQRFVRLMRRGIRAMTTQTYTEVNSKRGRQFYIAFYDEDLGSGAGVYDDLVIQVGAEPLAVKDIGLRFNSELISTRLYENPSFTGGTPIEVYNLRPARAVPNLVTVVANPTVTDEGIPDGPETYSIGSQGLGGRALNTVADTVGAERILEANTTYLFRVTNRDTVNNSRITAVATWYQGELDY